MATTFPSQSGLVTVTIKETKQFYLTHTDDINIQCKKILSGIRRKNTYHIPLRGLVDSVDDVTVSYEITPNVKTALVLKHQKMKEHFGNPLILNTTEWPLSPGVYKLTHKETGKTLIGYSRDIIGRKKLLKYRLANQRFENQTIQELYNRNKNFDDFSYSVEYTSTLTEAKLLARKIILSSGTDVEIVNLNIGVKKKPRYGFYVLKDKRSGQYITGVCLKPKDRINNIRWLLMNNRHRNEKLQNLFNTHRHTLSFEDMFDIDITMVVNQEGGRLLSLEHDKNNKHLGLCINTK